MARIDVRNSSGGKPHRVDEAGIGAESRSAPTLPPSSPGYLLKTPSFYQTPPRLNGKCPGDLINLSNPGFLLLEAKKSIKLYSSVVPLPPHMTRCNGRCQLPIPQLPRGYLRLISPRICDHSHGRGPGRSSGLHPDVHRVCGRLDSFRTQPRPR